MPSTVTANLMVQDAANKLTAVSQNMFPPQMAGSYEYVSSVAARLDAFLTNTPLSSECDGSIDYIVPATVTNTGTAGNVDQPALVMAYLDSSSLADSLGSSTAPTNTSLQQTVFVLPNLTELEMPEIPLLPTPPPTPQGYSISAQFTSAYLATVEDYVLSLEAGTIPDGAMTSLQIASERLNYDLDFALRQALAQTGAKGFRKPNSATTTTMGGIYTKYLDTVQQICAEFVATVFDLLAGAKGLGISSERVQIDFTTHLNDLTLAITAFQIKRYEDAIANSIATYNLAVAKINTSVIESQYRIKRSMYEVQETLLSLSAISTTNELSADHTRNLLAFADIYREGNQAWLKEKRQNAQVQTFNIQSEQTETMLNLEAEIQASSLSNAVLKANNEVLRDKLNILKTDLDAYAALTGAIPIDLQQAAANFDLLHKEFNLKLLSAGHIPQILAGAGNIIAAMLKSNIIVNKTKGTA